MTDSEATSQSGSSPTATSTLTVRTLATDPEDQPEQATAKTVLERLRRAESTSDRLRRIIRANPLFAAVSLGLVVLLLEAVLWWFLGIGLLSNLAYTYLPSSVTPQVTPPLTAGFVIVAVIGFVSIVIAILQEPPTPRPRGGTLTTFLVADPDGPAGQRLSLAYAAPELAPSALMIHLESLYAGQLVHAPEQANVATLLHRLSGTDATKHVFRIDIAEREAAHDAMLPAPTEPEGSGEDGGHTVLAHVARWLLDEDLPDDVIPGVIGITVQPLAHGHAFAQARAARLSRGTDSSRLRRAVGALDSGFQPPYPLCVKDPAKATRLNELVGAERTFASVTIRGVLFSRSEAEAAAISDTIAEIESRLQSGTTAAVDISAWTASDDTAGVRTRRRIDRLTDALKTGASRYDHPYILGVARRPTRTHLVADSTEVTDYVRLSPHPTLVRHMDFPRPVEDPADSAREARVSDLRATDDPWAQARDEGAATTAPEEGR